MRTKIIINPKASGYNERKLGELEKKLDRLGLNYEKVLTESYSHAESIARNSDGFDELLAFGGDGLAHYVINGMMGSNKTFGIIPLGNGNDYARSMKIFNIEKACGTFYNDETKLIDVGRVIGTSKDEIVDRYFISSLAVGYGGNVVKNLDKVPDWVRKSKIPMLSPYSYSALIVTPKEPTEMCIKYDGKIIEGKKFLAGALNTPYFGKGMKAAPREKMDDNKLGLIVADQLSPPEIMLYFLLIYKGWHIYSPKVNYEQADKIEMSFENPVYVQVDGELLSKNPLNNLYISCCHKALKVKT